MRECDEDTVRSLFAERGGDALRAEDLPAMMEAYASSCGKLLVAPGVAQQITAFAQDNAQLEIGVDEFLHMVSSLDQDMDDSVDTTASSLFDKTETSFDTTWDSIAPGSPAKTDILAQVARSDVQSASPSPRRRRLAASLSSIKSDSDINTAAARSAVIRKLARVSDELEHLQDDHQSLLAQKGKIETDNTSLRRQVSSLTKELKSMKEHEHLLESQVLGLEQQLKQTQAECEAHKMAAKQLDVRLQQRIASHAELEASEAQQEKELEAIRAQCEAYVVQLQSMQSTCQAHTDTISQLESTITALEQVQTDAERWQSEIEASRLMHARLEQELNELKQMTEQHGIPALSFDLAPWDDWVDLLDKADVEDDVDEASTEAQASVSTSSQAGSPSTSRSASPQTQPEPATPTRSSTLTHSEETPKPEPAVAKSLLLTANSESPTKEAGEKTELGDPSSSEGICTDLEDGHVLHTDTTTSELLPTTTDNEAVPPPFSATVASTTCPPPAVKMPVTADWQTLLSSTLKDVKVAPNAPGPTNYTWLRILGVHILLVLTGMWLGMWVYHWSLFGSPSHVYTIFMDRRWIETNMLTDTSMFDKPLEGSLSSFSSA